MNQQTQAMYDKMRAKLEKVVPDVELRIKAEIAVEINALKIERNAVILGHNYMEPALFYSIPDFVGDSLDLSRKAAQTDKDVIVFCGVKFMAETAKILNPSKTVLLPSDKAGCSLAAAITADDVRALKARFPGVPVVTYVNTYADVKAESDICCTSGNAMAVVQSLNTDKVIFLPDEYLGGNVARELGWNIVYPDLALTPAPLPITGEGKTMIGWRGRCEVHEKFTVNDIQTVRAQFPDVAVLAHRVQSRCDRRFRFFGQYQRNDQVRERVQRAAISGAHRMFDGRQHRRRKPREGHVAPVHDPLSAHEYDYDGRHSERVEVQPLRD